eukprot:8453400-Alexandrium_andersonii.AAC.1
MRHLTARADGLPTADWVQSVKAWLDAAYTLMAGSEFRPPRQVYPELTEAEPVLAWAGPLPARLACLRGRRL